ncbi:DMT family transporter [Pseudomonas sp. 5P_3.1_Bac2]|uniref:DMT family transporter n=1 Tax=Pseudomonas sp. 5P_3.1_Bac2 TaxID=2971617 RepID=UPI0021C5AEBD|nr:DMT family transporter [Pseudomonas sp. 5P_3.1_Bac2]MCU1718703.1 DMT family transporter [Pseudomonas sp. 5P_3.1_Bac2]
MGAARKNADALVLLLMLMLCALWGSQQVLLKFTAVDMATVLQLLLRSAIALPLALTLMMWQGGWQSWLRATWRSGCLTGALFAVEILLIGVGLNYTTAAHMTVLLYTAPIFSALGLHLLLPSERLNRLQCLGIALCFSGIVTAFALGRAGAQWDWRMLLGDGLGLLAGVAWGATTMVVRGSSLAEAPPSLTLFYQMLMAVVLLLPYGLLSHSFAPFEWTLLSVGSLLWQSLVVSFFSFLVWFWLLSRYLANSLAAFTFMTPLFGVSFAVWLLDEPITLNFVLGALLVLLGILLVSQHHWLRRGWQRVRRLA